MLATPAFAQAAGGAAGAAGGLISFVPIILIFAIMYFLMIRPQQKKVKDHKAMVEALRRGDQIVTAGGVIGKVTKVEDGKSEVEVEIAPNVRVRVVRSTIGQVLSKTEPAEPPDPLSTPGTRRRERPGGAGVSSRHVHYPLWKRLFVLAICLVGFVVVLPNLFYGRVEGAERRPQRRRARPVADAGDAGGEARLAGLCCPRGS